MKTNLSQTAVPAKPAEVPRGTSGIRDPVMKQAIAQEERRISHHSGKSIKRPARIGRSMDA